MGYRKIRLANITLTSEQEAAWNASTERVSDSDFDAPWLTAEAVEYEEHLRAAYRSATGAQDRWEIIEDWLAHLVLTRSEMNDEERGIYGRRIASLIDVARTAIMREVRRAKFESYEDHLARDSKAGPKIIIDGWSDDITRIHESAYEVALYVLKPEKMLASQVAAMYYSERPTKDLVANVRASRSRISDRKTESPKLVLFMKKMLEKFTPKSIEEIEAYAMTLLERAGR